AAEPATFERREEAIAAADIVISSTAAPGFVIDATMIERAMAGRAARPLLLIDIAVPRDIDPAAREVAGVHLSDIDELQVVSDRNMELRRAAIVEAERLIDDDVAKFGEWLQSLQALPTVAALRERAEALRAAEVERTLAKTAMSAADRERIEAMSAA